MAERDEARDDRYKRGSFTLRRMTQGQVWAITIVGVVVLIGLLLYGAST